MATALPYAKWEVLVDFDRLPTDGILSWVDRETTKDNERMVSFYRKYRRLIEAGDRSQHEQAGDIAMKIGEHLTTLDRQGDAAIWHATDVAHQLAARHLPVRATKANNHPAPVCVALFKYGECLNGLGRYEEAATAHAMQLEAADAALKRRDASAELDLRTTRQGALQRLGVVHANAAAKLDEADSDDAPTTLEATCNKLVLERRLEALRATAISILRRACAATSELRDKQSARDKRLATLCDLANAHRDAGEYPEALGVLQAAREMLRHIPKELRAGPDDKLLNALTTYSLADVLNSTNHFREGDIVVGVVSADGKVSAIERRAVAMRSAQHYAKRAVSAYKGVDPNGQVDATNLQVLIEERMQDAETEDEDALADATMGSEMPPSERYDMLTDAAVQLASKANLREKDFSQRVELLRGSCERYERALSCLTGSSEEEQISYANTIDGLEINLAEWGRLLAARSHPAAGEVEERRLGRRTELEALCKRVGGRQCSRLPTPEDGRLAVVDWSGRGGGTTTKAGVSSASASAAAASGASAGAVPNLLDRGKRAAGDLLSAATRPEPSSAAREAAAAMRDGSDGVRGGGAASAAHAKRQRPSAGEDENGFPDGRRVGGAADHSRFIRKRVVCLDDEEEAEEPAAGIGVTGIGGAEEDEEEDEDDDEDDDEIMRPNTDGVRCTMGHLMVRFTGTSQHANLKCDGAGCNRRIARLTRYSCTVGNCDMDLCLQCAGVSDSPPRASAHRKAPSNTRAMHKAPLARPPTAEIECGQPASMPPRRPCCERIPTAEEVEAEMAAARAAQSADTPHTSIGGGKGGMAGGGRRFARSLETVVCCGEDEWLVYVPHPTSLEAMAEEGASGFGTVGWLLEKLRLRLLDESCIALRSTPPPSLHLHAPPPARDVDAAVSDSTPPPAAPSAATHAPLCAADDLWSLLPPGAPPTLHLHLAASRCCAMPPVKVYEAHCTTSRIDPSPRVTALLKRASKQPLPTAAPVDEEDEGDGSWVAPAQPAAAYTVELAHIGIGDESALAALLTSLGSMSCELGSLCLTNGAVGAAQLALFTSRLPHHAPLAHLDLASQQLSASAIEHLLAAGARGACPHLTHLRLDCNPCADAMPSEDMSAESVATCFGELPSGRGGWRLRSLGLACTFLGEGGLLALAAGVARAPRLRALDVSRNALTLGEHAADGSAAMRRLCVAWAETGGRVDGELVTV